MKNISLILYITGLIGLILSIIICGVRSSKNKKAVNIPMFLSIMVFFFTLLSGALFSIFNKNNDNNPMVTDAVASEEVPKETAKENMNKILDNNDLLKLIAVDIEIKGISSSDKKNLLINITNNSELEFTGYLTVSIKDYRSEVVDSLSIPIKSLIPKGSFSNFTETNLLAKTSDYNLEGNFEESPHKTSQEGFALHSASQGKEFITFNILVKDTDNIELLKNISKEFRNTYTKDVSNGFFIFFFKENPSNDNTPYTYGNAFAEYYCNYRNSVSLLSLYNKNENLIIP